jgi:hypothetical protein
MVNDMDRFVSINRHINNSLIATKILKDVTEVLASELVAYADTLKESGDDFGFVPGLLKASKIIKTKEGF